MMYILLYSTEQESKKALSALVATTVLSTPDRSMTSSKQHLQGGFPWHRYSTGDQKSANRRPTVSE